MNEPKPLTFFTKRPLFGVDDKIGYSTSVIRNGQAPMNGFFFNLAETGRKGGRIPITNLLLNTCGPCIATDEFLVIHVSTSVGSFEYSIGLSDKCGQCGRIVDCPLASQLKRNAGFQAICGRAVAGTP